MNAPVDLSGSLGGDLHGVLHDAAHASPLATDAATGAVVVLGARYGRGGEGEDGSLEASITSA